MYAPSGRLDEVRVYPVPSAGTISLAPSPASEGVTKERSTERWLSNEDELVQRVTAVVELQGGHEAALTRDDVLTLLETQNEPVTRARALEALATFGPVPVAPVADVALFDPEPGVGLEATGLLGRQAAYDPLARVFTAPRRVRAGYSFSIRWLK